MRSISVKVGDRFAVGEDTVVEFDRVCGSSVRLNVDSLDEVSVLHRADAEPSEAELQEQLRELASGIASDLSVLEPERCKELLGVFVSDLFLSVTEQNRRENRRQRQAEGIAAAKARGVRFGRPAPPLPEDFEEYHQAWRDGRMSVREAADACGMSRSSFYNAAIRAEQSADCAV